jgi:hypothetical protein
MAKGVSMEMGDVESTDASWKKLTDDELRANAENIGIKGFETLSRSELIQRISDYFRPRRLVASSVGIHNRGNNLMASGIQTCSFFLECDKCNRVYIPLENAGIMPIAFAAILSMAKTERGAFPPDLIQSIEGAMKLPPPLDAETLSAINMYELPDIVFGGNQRKESFQRIYLDPGTLNFTAAVVHRLTNKDLLADKTRFWRCCDTVQTYIRKPFLTKSFGADTLDQAIKKLESYLFSGL